MFVQYLGCVEVFESRGIQVCEEAISVLRNVSSFLSHFLVYFLTFCLKPLFTHIVKENVHKFYHIFTTDLNLQLCAFLWKCSLQLKLMIFVWVDYIMDLLYGY